MPAFLLAARAILGRIPSWAWIAIAAVLALWGVWHWHGVQVRAAYANGAAVQKAADTAAFNTAADEAARLQHALVEAAVARQSTISSETQHALAARNADLARSYADLRMRWAAYRSDQGRPGEGGTTAVSDATGPTDITACAASGWVAFDTAAAAAEAADTAIAKDDAWIKWAAEQEAAWPKP